MDEAIAGNGAETISHETVRNMHKRIDRTKGCEQRPEFIPPMTALNIWINHAAIAESAVMKPPIIR